MYKTPKKSKESRPSKCYFTQLITEEREGSEKPSLSKKPYSLTQSLPWSHTVDLVLPDEIYHIVQQRLSSAAHNTLRYSRVFMSLLDVLSGDFFTRYIKTGNVILRSQGRLLVDNIYYLHSGVLHLELDRPTYERCGLVGEPIPDGGRKHTKQRFLVKVNLRLPSMLHGKKGFERVLRAAREVLTGDVEWLFSDLDHGSEQGEKPIDQFHPMRYEAGPTVVTEDALTPQLPEDAQEVDYEYAEALSEWLGLICIGSPRVKGNDDVDPFFCRYRIPQQQSQRTDAVDHASKRTSRIVHMRWRGFACPDFVKGVMSAAERAAIERRSWFAVNVCSFEGQSYTVLGTHGKSWLCWQCER